MRQKLVLCRICNRLRNIQSNKRICRECEYQAKLRQKEEDEL